MAGSQQEPATASSLPTTSRRTGQVIYKAEKDACRAFPEPQGDGLKRGTKRNFQILDPLDFLAEFTQHIPPKGSHLIRGHRPKVGRGWYSNKSRGMRKKAAAADVVAGGQPTASSRDTAHPAVRFSTAEPCQHDSRLPIRWGRV